MTMMEQHKGYIIEFNQKPFVCGHDYDVYKYGEEEQGFTAESVERAVELIDAIIENGDLKMRATSNGVTVKSVAYHDANLNTNACKDCALWKRRCTKLDSDLGIAVQAAEAWTGRSCFAQPYIWVKEDV